MYRPHNFNADAGITVGMASANVKRRYIVTLSLIGWGYTKNNPCDEQMRRYLPMK